MRSWAALRTSSESFWDMVDFDFHQLKQLAHFIYMSNHLKT